MFNNILVTGAGGFIGFDLANYLARSGFHVSGIDIFYPRNENLLSFNALKFDFRQADQARMAMKNIDCLIHLASAHLNVHLSHSEYWDINVHSIRALLDSARDSGVKKIIHVSSVGVYGNLDVWPADESTVCKPQSIYGQTKLAGEHEVMKFYRETGLPTVILRPAWVYGERCPRTQKLLKMLRKKHFIMIGEGKNMRHPLYISDFLKIIEQLLKNNHSSGDMFLIAGPEYLTTSELVATICQVFNLDYPRFRIPMLAGKVAALSAEKLFQLIGRESPVSKRTLEFFNTNNAFDISRARSILTFNPQYTFEKGLQKIKLKME